MFGPPSPMSDDDDVCLPAGEPGRADYRPYPGPIRRPISSRPWVLYNADGVIQGQIQGETDVPDEVFVPTYVALQQTNYPVCDH